MQASVKVLCASVRRHCSSERQVVAVVEMLFDCGATMHQLRADGEECLGFIYPESLLEDFYCNSVACCAAALSNLRVSGWLRGTNAIATEEESLIDSFQSDFYFGPSLV